MNQQSEQIISGGVYVIAAPSGAGKTSLVKALVESSDNINVAVSHTTRPMRPHEVDGVNYHFVSAADFQALQSKDEFIESARVFGNYYGTSRSAMTRVTDQGINLVLEIDWQGAQQIRSAVPEAKTIFIFPPSLETLHDRLLGRNQDDVATIQARMAEAISEMSHYAEFDYLIVNNIFEAALDELKQIFRGEGETLRLSVQALKFRELIKELLPNQD